MTALYDRYREHPAQKALVDRLAFEIMSTGADREDAQRQLDHWQMLHADNLVRERPNVPRWIAMQLAASLATATMERLDYLGAWQRCGGSA